MRSGHAETESVGIFSGDLEAPIAILPPGTLLGSRYAIRHVLGIGGSSVVYSADDSKTLRRVAVKVLRADRSTEATLARFRDEATIARELDFPHLVRGFDYAEGPPAYLTMELASKGSLQNFIRNGRMPVATALDIAEQVLHALTVLHDRSLLHCDVKPGNIFLDADARVLLGDFGLARPTSMHSGERGNESVLGTLQYLAPEQALGLALDARTDLYALGIVLFEMLTGTVPHRRASSLGTLLAHIQEPARNVRQLRPDTPQWLARMIARLLVKKPGNRHASAAVVLHEIERHHGHHEPAVVVAQDQRRLDHTLVRRRALSWRLRAEMP